MQKDDVEAVKWFRKAAEQGDAQAQLSLGYCYAKSEGVPEDDAVAVKWFRKAAEQGNARAQFNLGLNYAQGKGVPQDDVTAYMWFNLSSAQGNDYAIEGRDIIIQLMTKEQIAEGQKLSRECQERFDKREKK